MQAIKNSIPTELRTWDKLRILVGEERDAGQYVARVEEIINGGVIITHPEFISGSTLLRNELPVIVQIAREDAAYQFHSRIRLHGSGATRRFILTPPRGIKRVQRRMFARVDFTTRVEYAPLPTGNDKMDWEQNEGWCESNVVNMSAGGLLIISDDALRTGMLLALRLGDFRQADLPPNFLAVCRRTFSSEGERYAGLEFILVSEFGKHLSRGEISRLPESYKLFDRRMQDRLVNFLFQKQIELRQKGLI